MSVLTLNVDEVMRTLSNDGQYPFVVKDKTVDIVRFAINSGFADIVLDGQVALRVMYQRPGETEVRAQTLTYYDTDGLHNYYDWQLSQSDLTKDGSLMVALCILDISGGEVSEWHTTPCAVRVLSTIHTDDSDEGDETITPTVVQRVAVLETMIQRVASGAPIVVASTSDMTDTAQIYVLSTDGNWYYHNGAIWVAGGEYGAVSTDTTLTQSGIPADAKVVGDRLNVVEQDIETAQTDISDVYEGKPVEVSGVNKLNPSEIEQGKNITITGDVTDYSGTDISGYITIDTDKTSVAFTGLNASGTARVCLPISRILFYNSSKTVISYASDVASNRITPIPDAASYVRFVITSGYMRERQPMVEFVDGISGISSVYVEYEAVIGRGHGINYLDETQQNILTRLEAVEELSEQIDPLSDKTEENTDDITLLRSDVDDLIGNPKPISTLGTFADGGINSSTGNYDSYYKYRVSTPDITTISKDYSVSITTGFRLYVATFVNGVLSDKGWKAEGYILRKDSTVRLMIARTTEDSSEVADVDDFCTSVTISSLSSMSQYQEQIDASNEKIANINAVIPYGITWDWWITANGVDAFGNAYIGYIDTDGYAGVLRRQPDGVMQYKRLESSRSDDDHNGMATIILDDGRVLVMGSHGHGQDNHIICWRSQTAYSIDAMDKLSFDIPQGDTYSYKTTYSQIFKYGGKLFNFLRCTVTSTGSASVTGYLCLISSDNGSTWTTYQVLTFGDPYVTFAQCADDDKTLKMVLGVNPSSGTFTFKGCLIDLSTYKIYDLQNAEIGQMVALGTGTYDSSVIAKPADMTSLTAQTIDGKKGRLFTVAKTDKSSTVFLFATATDSTSTDYTYKLYDNGTITEIGMSGVPFGNVSYISGVCFGKDEDTLYYAKATTEKADGDHELHKVKMSNGTVQSDVIITESSMCILRPLFLGNGELATVVGHYNDQNSDGTYNGSFTAWELKPMFTNA